MLADIPEMKPDLTLVRRLDRFGVKDANELGYFLTRDHGFFIAA